MGKIRSYQYDAIIGIGGLKPWSENIFIRKKLTWIGFNSQKTIDQDNVPIVTFDVFILMDENGPLLEKYAPTLAKRMYGYRGPRFLLKKYSDKEYDEAKDLIEKAKTGYFQKYQKASSSETIVCSSNCSYYRA